jgi:alkylation response protein AidB-like acyl-CoA dehydrogenase
VHIGPDSDQLDLHDIMRAVLAAECPLTLARAAYTDSQAWQRLWKTTVELGWSSLAQRGLEDGDDLGLSTLDLVLALEACGAALAPFPFLSSVGLAAGVARTGGSAMSAVLAEITAGTIATLLAQPADQRLPGATLTLADGRIRGTAIAVPDADCAEVFVALCVDTDEQVFAIAIRADSVAIDARESADPSRRLATVIVDAPLQDAVAVGPATAAETALAPALLAVAAELVGVAQGALDLAVDHARTRAQFGKPIGSYQGVKHALADNRVAIERARSLSYLAAARLDDPTATAPDQYGACALAKATASEAALQCTRTAVQVLGALGQTWEHDAHLYLRRAWVGAAQLGASSRLFHLVGRRYLTGTPS